MMVHGSSIATTSLSAPSTENGWYGLKIFYQSFLQIFFIDDATQVRDVVVDGAKIECDQVLIIQQNFSKRRACLRVLDDFNTKIWCQLFFLIVTERTLRRRMLEKTPSDTKELERSAVPALTKDATRERGRPTPGHIETFFQPSFQT